MAGITGLQTYFNSASNQFEFTGTSTGGNVLSSWYVGLSGPDGAIKVLDLLTEDVSGVALSLTVANTVGIMVDGDYVLQVVFATNRSGSPEEVYSETFNFTLALTGTSNYSLSQNGVSITARDTTTYPASSPTLTFVTTFTRSSTLVPPIVAGVTASPIYVFTGVTSTIPMALANGLIYENVTWSISGQTSGQFVETSALDSSSGSWFVVYDRTYTGSNSLLVLIGTDACGIISCLDTTWLTMYNQACRAGGVSKLPTAVFDDMILLLGNMMMYQYWSACGNTTKSVEYYNLLNNSATCLSLPIGPVAVGGEVTGSTWTTIDSSDFVNGYLPEAGNPFQFTIINKSIYFRGGITPTSFDAAGEDIIDPDYWSDLGIVFENGVRFDCQDTDAANADGMCYGLTQNGTLKVFEYSGNSDVHNFEIIGNLPLV